MNFYDTVISETEPAFTGEKWADGGQFVVPTMVNIRKGDKYTLVRLKNIKKSSWRAFKRQVAKLEKHLISLFGVDFEFEFFGEVYAEEFKQFPTRRGIVGVWSNPRPRRARKGLGTLPKRNCETHAMLWDM